MAAKEDAEYRDSLSSMYEDAANTVVVQRAWEEGRLEDVLELGRQHANNLSQQALEEYREEQRNRRR